MKTQLTIVFVALLVCRPAAGDALRNTIQGGVLGAAAGALVAEFSDDYDARQTIPLFTGLGALSGYAVHQNRHTYGPRRHRSYRAAYALPYLALPYAWYVSRHPTRRWSEAPAPASRRQSRPPIAPIPPHDRHPGVRLFPVPISLPNGTVVPINILKIGDRFIGPQGESYDSMPSAETLLHRYHPAL